jgi:hypothetical protein
MEEFTPYDCPNPTGLFSEAQRESVETHARKIAAAHHIMIPGDRAGLGKEGKL